MEDCSWVALVIFAFIVLFMMWLHANFISPWLVSYFRDQQLTELQQRIKGQQAAAAALQAQVELQARQRALAAQKAAEDARREALARQQQSARKPAAVANTVTKNTKQNAAKAIAVLKSGGHQPTKAMTNLAKLLKKKK